MIHVVATITLRPGTRARFLEDFQRLVPLVRAEEGCLEYGGAVDVPSGLSAQEPLRGDVVTVVEKWASRAALAAHLAIPHMAAHRERVKDFALGTSLLVMEPAGEP
jgi:quinol monooxygenase YgiN